MSKGLKAEVVYSAGDALKGKLHKIEHILGHRKIFRMCEEAGCSTAAPDDEYDEDGEKD
ncbi:MAG: hypothetical protein ACYSUC_04325 [Planctomycetota bacterium]